MPLSAEENVLLDEIAARIHREGVIEGLERALSHASDPGLSNWAIRRLIKIDVERLRGEQKEGAE